MRVVIVGSGPTARGFKPPAGVVVIAVNGAIGWLPRADYFFTLDPSPINISRLRNQRIGVKYCYAYDHVLNIANAEFYERIAGCEFITPKPYSPQWFCNRWGCRLGLSNRVGQIHTGNSAYGALGLAYHLGATKVALVGIDANSAPRLEGGTPNNLSHLPLLFESAMAQINFINCGSMHSAVPQKTIAEGMEWLCK
jgi:hypothetical protein